MNAASPSPLLARRGSEALPRQARITFPVTAPKLLPAPAATHPFPASVQRQAEDRLLFLMPEFFQGRVPARHWGINE